MKRKQNVALFILIAIILSLLLLYSCTPPKTETFRPVKIADNEIDPAKWGQAYPLHYELWKKTEEPTEAEKTNIKEVSTQTK